MPSLTAREARKRLYRLLDDVAESHEPVQIADKLAPLRCTASILLALFRSGASRWDNGRNCRQDGGGTVCRSHNRHSAVLVSEEDWRAIQETVYLTSIPGMRESILKGLKTPVGKCAEELDW